MKSIAGGFSQPAYQHCVLKPIERARVLFCAQRYEGDDNGKLQQEASFLARIPDWTPSGVLTLFALSPSVAEAAPFAYIGNQTSNSVSVIDTATNTVVATVPTGDSTHGVAVTPNGAFVYVTNHFSSMVSVIDTATNKVVATVKVGTYPNAFGQFIGPRPPREGDLDTSFSDHGYVLTNFGANEFATAITLQGDGKIVVTGTSYDANRIGDLLVARYLPNGNLDNRFSGNGWVTSDLGVNEMANAMVLRPDGKILVAGTSIDSSGQGNFLLARYLPNGSLDNSFSGNGWVTTDLEPSTAKVSRPCRSATA